ncbi:MAG: hypothetical protein EB107_05830 [Proteobacteria bacterium]|nr:hypothetical protein [Pseudomonadota bacterium]
MPAAIRVTLMLDVLVARIASGPKCSAALPNASRFAPTSSIIASIITEARDASSSADLVEILPMISSRTSPVTSPRAILRAKPVAMRSRARVRAPGEGSTISTAIPAVAIT